MRYSLAKPYLDRREERAVVRVLRRGVLSLGPEQNRFEENFARFVGMRYAVAVASGTAGLHLVLIAAGIGPGDEVITTPFSFIASANATLYVGARPVFVDIEPVTYNLDPALVAKKITPRTKAILVVHIFGQTADMAPIMRLARQRGLVVIEDACESLGATYRGRKVGTFGQSAVFAFYANKQMTTGEGGMIVTNSRRVADLCRSLANQGRSANMQWLDHQYLGYNYRLDELSAAVGVEQLKKLPGMIRRRQQLAEWYRQALAPHADLIAAPEIAYPNTHTWFVYVVQINKHRVNRDAVIRSLARAGIASKPYLPSIHLFSFYRARFGFRPGSFPVSEGVSARSLALPFYLGLARADVARIVTTLLQVVKKQL